MFSLLARKPVDIRYSYQEATVIAVVHPGRKWRIRFRATDWFACSINEAEIDTEIYSVGDFVRVVGVVNATTLLIEPL